MPEDAPAPGRQTAYDLAALREAYGDVPVFELSFEVTDASEHAAEAAAGELGGAGVILSRERDDAELYVDNLSDPADWDVPGGARENGEAVEQTAVREVHEEVGLAVELDELAFVHEVTFDDGEHAVAGIWAHFSATVADPGELDVQHEELGATTWRTDRPADLDDFPARALDALDKR